MKMVLSHGMPMMYFFEVFHDDDWADKLEKAPGMDAIQKPDGLRKNWLICYIVTNVTDRVSYCSNVVMLRRGSTDSKLDTQRTI